jgi:hypothetical protein
MGLKQYDWEEIAFFCNSLIARIRFLSSSCGRYVGVGVMTCPMESFDSVFVTSVSGGVKSL